MVGTPASGRELFIERLDGVGYGQEMAEVPSTFQLQPGSAAPDFELPDGHGVMHSLKTIATGKKATVVVFACNHCPFVVHLAESLGAMARAQLARGVQFVAINSNDAARYPSDGPDLMPGFAQKHGWDFPYLFDESQSVAKAYAAACTPDFYVFDSELRLAYAGQYDATRPGGSGPVTGTDLLAAIESVHDSGRGPALPWQPSSGCSIKWKPGCEPAYA